MRNVAFVINISFVALLVGACAKNESMTASPVVENNATILDARVTLTNTQVTLDTPVAYQKAAVGPDPGLLLTLVASVEPPVYNGVTLQATEVIVKGNKAYVGYNVKGETFLGAVEVFDISNKNVPSLESSLILPGVDVNGIAVRDNDLYVAAASGDGALTSPAIMDTIRLQGGLLTTSITRNQLSSYAATDIDIVGNNIFVTSGSLGGAVTVLSTASLSTVTVHTMDDARGVDTDANNVAVVAGGDSTTSASAKLFLYDKDAGTLQASYDLVGATIPYSKSTVELKKGKAVLALGDGGTQVLCLADGRVIETVDQPVVSGLASGVTVTNAASAYKNAIFMANGEAGIYVAISDSNFATPGCDVTNLRVVGKLALGDAVSANHIIYRNDMLFVANGTGGLKMITVDLGNDMLDDDDGR